MLEDNTKSRYDTFLEAYLSNEFRLVNSSLPRNRRRLSELLIEDQPSVLCADGSQQLFKRAELQYLERILDEEERRELLLPIIIEMSGDGTESVVLCSSNAELKVLSDVLEMELSYERPGRVRLYRPQLSVLRRRLRTTTQYAFSARVIA
ncbi:MAG TPA: DUF61 family protein [Dehalococcoidia bacterium]|nr:DUF61 family protein [Dehalococcoidia bacterium]